MNPKKPRDNCKVCGASLARVTGIYCSNACQVKHQRATWIARWLAGHEHGIIYGGATSKHIKAWLIKCHGEKCCLCGWCERNAKTDSIPIELDHIDGDYRNNRPENLRLLCPNCHALTSSYGSRNRGNGRPFFVHKKLNPS